MSDQAGSTTGARTPNVPRVVTIGGGHGQAQLLAALRRFRVKVSAIVSIADDGGCSGLLRRAEGIPPPGDVRRCLTALASHRGLAERFERRLVVGPGPTRSAGNLVLALARERLGSLQAAADWAANLLEAEGRVLPVAETPGVLVVYDATRDIVEGESHIEAVARAPLAAGVHGSAAANPEALAAIGRADLLLIGPGSFFTSTLAVINTDGVARACVESGARCCFVANVADEGEQTANWPLERYVRLLRDHLTIASLGGERRFEVLAHHHSDYAEWALEDGTRIMQAPVARPGAREHDPDLLATALSRWFDLVPRSAKRREPRQNSASVTAFEQQLVLAMSRFAHGTVGQ